MMRLKNTTRTTMTGKKKEATTADDTWLGPQKGKGIRATRGCGRWERSNCEQGGLVWTKIHGMIYERGWRVGYLY